MRLDLYRTTSSRRPEQKLPFFKRKPVKRAFLSGLGLIIAAAGLTGYLWRAPLGEKMIALSAQSGLNLQEIVIKGRINTDKAVMEQLVADLWYKPMITLDLRAIHHEVADLGWVRGAKVERVLPSKLVITIEERHALALYQNDQGHQVIDHTGAVIKGVKPELFTHLPVIKGPNAPQNAHAILATLKTEDNLYADVWSLTYQSNRRWDVYLRNNIRIQLPEKDAGIAWSNLAEMDRQHRLTKRDVVNIDLRVPKKLVIRPSRSNTTKGSST